MISGPAVCVPDSILLSSRERLPDTLKSINTLPYKKGNVSTKVFGSVGISLPPQFNIISELKSVWIYIPVERATEKEITVSLLPDFINGGNVDLIPSIVKLMCRVPLSRYDQTTNDQFMVTASITSSNQKKAVVSVKNAPFWAEHISIKPATVDYFYHN